MRLYFHILLFLGTFFSPITVPNVLAELEIAKSLQRKLEAPGALDNIPFADNKIRLLEILINDDCPIKNIKLKSGITLTPAVKSQIMSLLK